MSGVPLAVGALAIAIAIAIAMWGDMQWPRTVVLLVATGVAGMLNGSFGPGIHDAVTAADRTASPFIGQWTGLALGTLAGLAVFAFLGFRVWKQQIDMVTLGAAALLPIVAPFIPGRAGGIVMTIIGFAATAVSAVFRFFFGIG